MSRPENARQAAALVMEQQAARIAELEAALAAATAPKPKVSERIGSCECGCGAVVRGRARFQMGHDAKLKSALIQTALSGAAAEAESATGQLVALGWVGFLHAAQDRKAAKVRARLEREAKKQAEAAAEEARLDAIVAEAVAS